MSSLEPSISTEVPASDVMLQMISGFWVSRAIHAAAKLGIADYLKEQPKTLEELAAITDTHVPSLYRLLRALASVGIFAEDDDHRFFLTPLAATLQTDVPGSLRFFAISELGQVHYLGWDNLLHSIKTGEIAFDHIAGMSVWDYYLKNSEAGNLFNWAMTNLTASVLEAIICSYDFSAFNTIVDVGGGQGSLVTSILKAYPTVKGIIFDIPTVIEEAKSRLQAQGFADPSGSQWPAEGNPPAALSHRCTVVSGNFFESVTAGGDAYLLKHIIHDWDEEKAIAILKNCHQAMSKHGTLLLFETVIPRGNVSSFSKLLDLNMLVMTGGRERTEEEYQVLLQKAGFQLTQVIPTSSPISVIEALKI
ncbi:acetylserotonin O-methyltransferase [Nostoc sp. CHAB 5836]|uniref:acetylserotonin O-methyltransferase n=1 Tax=Nostoc sp. CHAB 5836 TaxID=2780404 RepID=UPI001E29A452|nr:acetylserotonin O-methyltransferase [Nostoc sp. CHAB 5836]MCC5617198.1 acetylserotonin O-methyltransferase [Nostoc sp. CHAB 5836]